MCRAAGPFAGSWATFFYLGDYYHALTQKYNILTVGWSLGVEEKFYLLWPFLLVHIPRTKLVKCLCAVLIFEPIYRSLLSVLGYRAYTWFAFDTHLDSIVVGCLIAIVVRRGWAAPKWIRHPLYSDLRTHPGVCPSVSRRYRDLPARSDPDFCHLSAARSSEQSDCPILRSDLLFPLSLPRLRPGCSLAERLWHLPYPEFRLHLRFAACSGNRLGLCSSLDRRAAVPETQRSLPWQKESASRRIDKLPGSPPMNCLLNAALVGANFCGVQRRNTSGINGRTDLPDSKPVGPSEGRKQRPAP